MVSICGDNRVDALTAFEIEAYACNMRAVNSLERAKFEDALDNLLKARAIY